MFPLKLKHQEPDTDIRAIVIHSAKDLRIEETKVAGPGDGEVLVRIITGGICGSDLQLLQSRWFWGHSLEAAHDIRARSFRDGRGSGIRH